MNAVKDSMLIRMHDAEVEDITILYTDLRAFGKGYDDFVKRSFEEQSAHYIRGRPAKIEETAESQDLVVFVEDTLEHKAKQIDVDLVVLSLAAAPSDGAKELAQALGVNTDQYGFIARHDPAISAVETDRVGVYVCGSAAGPQVIPDCVAQASAAAARAQMFLTDERDEEEKPEIKQMDLSGPPRVGVLICHCGINISGVLDTAELAAIAGQLPDVVVADEHQFACASVGQDKLVEMIKEFGVNRVVVAACTPRTHEPVFQDTLAGIGFNPYLLEMVNIRDQCSWVHSTQPEAPSCIGSRCRAHDTGCIGDRWWDRWDSSRDGSRRARFPHHPSGKDWAAWWKAGCAESEIALSEHAVCRGCFGGES
jgi:heterodisulfide reductase subunit A